MSAVRRVLIVGGSIGAVETATRLRDLAFDGDVTVLSEEAVAPYLRVPLSKAVLAGEQEPGSTVIAVPDDDLELVLGARAVALDRASRQVTTADGRVWPYDRLVVATGARARRISEHPAECVLRTLDDGVLLSARMAASKSVLVVGAGFLGMEIASTALGLDLNVTVVDRDPPLERLLGAELGSWMASRAAARGVRVVHAPRGVVLEAAAGSPIARTGTGELLSADVVVTAAGDLPNIEWLAGSGLNTDPGLRVDVAGRAAADVYGVGDVTSRLVNGRWSRTPYWSASLEQARAVASSIALAEPPPTAETPYYWTEQFGLTVRLCGAFPPSGPTHELEGSLAEESAVLGWAGADGTPVTVASVNYRMPVGQLKRRLASTAAVA